MKSKQVQVRFTEEELEMVDTMAQESTRNRSDMLRHLIKQAWKSRGTSSTPATEALPVVEIVRQ